MKRGEIKLYNETLTDLPAYLLTRGVPLPPGAVRHPAGVRVVNAKGKVLPSAGKVLQKRPDGSIEWLLMDILTPLGGQEKASIFVEPAPGKQPSVKNPVKVLKEGRQLTLTNGLSAVTVSGEGGALIRKLIVNGRTIVDEGMLVDLECVDAGGKIHRASLSGRFTLSVPHRNPLRTTIMLEGKHKARDGATFMDFALRFTLTANSPDVKIEHTFYCREPREGKIAIRSMRLVMPTTMDGAATKLLRQNTRGYDSVYHDLEVKENAEIVASGTGDLDNYKDPGAAVAHQIAGGAVFLRNPDSFHEDWSAYPFQMRPGQSSGFRAWHASVGMRHVQPVVGWKQKDFTLVTAFEHFRQLHPKAIDIDESRIAWSIWPAWSSPMQVVQGVSKSHSFWITGEKRALNMDDVIDVLYRWEYGYVEPVDVSFDPAWPAFCEVLDCQHLFPYQPEKYPLLENLIEVAPAAGNPGRHTYDRMPATGMFHFGDLVGPSAGSTDAGTCNNNEDDLLVFFPLLQFLRTGHTYCWDYGKEAARHYLEVDFCEWSTEDRRRGGLIAHTGGHFVGCVYPSHQWAEGLLAYYYLSGDERAKQAVIGCGDNNVWWAYNKTELTCCDGREAGMPLVNLAAAYRLTRDEKYIMAAKHIIKNFFLKWMKKYGTFKYPYPQTWQKVPHKLITGYGDWSSFAGLYSLWVVTGKEEFRTLGVKMLQDSVKPGSFSLNDIRGMDFFAAWALGRMTGDMDDVFHRVGSAIPMLLRRGGHPLRRLHFLKEMDERGLIDERQVGNRAGVI
jgi:hypothetical protein